MHEMDLSRVIEEFARPLLEAAESPEQRGAALELAATCWNLAVLPPEEVEARFAEMSERLCRTDPAQLVRFTQVYGMLLERKARLFPDLKTPITGFELHDHAIRAGQGRSVTDGLDPAQIPDESRED